MESEDKNSWKLKLSVMLGAIVSAILASVCCFGPLLIAVLGVGSMSLMHKFTLLRPYISVVMLGLLGLGFYLTYRKKAEVCEPDQACAKPRASKINKISQWIAVGLGVLFWAFPYYSRFILN